MVQTADQSLRHTISIRHLISFRTKMSATERGDDNHASGNTAISLHRAEPKEVEGNVRAVSLVQEIFSDPAENEAQIDRNNYGTMLFMSKQVSLPKIS